MKILALDTSGQTASAAIVDDQQTVGELTVHTQGLMTHSEIVLDMINHLFRLTRLTVDDMDYIACVNGPGSFTGLRIGAATAQGLARGAGKKLLAVPTLDALAYNIGYATPDTLVVPMMDARRAQVYTALYRTQHTGFIQRDSDYMAMSVTELLARIAEASPGQVVFVGDGATAYRDILHMVTFRHYLAPSNNNRQRAASVGTCAVEMLTHQVEPAPFALLYIRRPQAERVRFGENQ